MGSTIAGYFNLEARSLIELYYHTGVDDTVAKVFDLTLDKILATPV